MHGFVVTPLVVLLSIVSLVVIMIGGFHKKSYKALALWAATALGLMVAGAIGVAVVPAEYFGIPERFSLFAATGFNAVVGVYLFRGFRASPSKSSHID